MEIDKKMNTLVIQYKPFGLDTSAFRTRFIPVETSWSKSDFESALNKFLSELSSRASYFFSRKASIYEEEEAATKGLVDQKEIDNKGALFFNKRDAISKEMQKMRTEFVFIFDNGILDLSGAFFSNVENRKEPFSDSLKVFTLTEWVEYYYQSGDRTVQL